MLNYLIFFLLLNSGIDLALSCVPCGDISDSTTKTAPATTTTPYPDGSCGQSMYNIVRRTGIVGGIEARNNEYPSIVRLYNSRCRVFAGTIITESYVLTAAHCIKYTSYVYVYFADHNMRYTDNEEFRVRATEIQIHERYNESTFDYDFALIKLPTRLDFKESWRWQASCLPSSCNYRTCQEGEHAYIVGWGRLYSGGPLPYVLNHARTVIASTRTCKRQYGGIGRITDNMICAGYKSGRIDTCQGDSGGPLYTKEYGRFIVCGVTSWGFGCAEPNHYGVYARTCRAVDWIKKITRSA